MTNFKNFREEVQGPMGGGGGGRVPNKIFTVFSSSLKVFSWFFYSLVANNFMAMFPCSLKPMGKPGTDWRPNCISGVWEVDIFRSEYKPRLIISMSFEFRISNQSRSQGPCSSLSLVTWNLSIWIWKAKLKGVCKKALSDVWLTTGFSFQIALHLLVKKRRIWQYIKFHLGPYSMHPFNYSTCIQSKICY